MPLHYVSIESVYDAIAHSDADCSGDFEAADLRAGMLAFWRAYDARSTGRSMSHCATMAGYRRTENIAFSEYAYSIHEIDSLVAKIRVPDLHLRTIVARTYKRKLLALVRFMVPCQRAFDKAEAFAYEDNLHTDIHELIHGFAMACPPPAPRSCRLPASRRPDS